MSAADPVAWSLALAADQARTFDRLGPTWAPTVEEQTEAKRLAAELIGQLRAGDPTEAPDFLWCLVSAAGSRSAVAFRGLLRELQCHLRDSVARERES